MLVDVLLPLNFNQLFTYKSNIDLDEGDVVRLNFKNKEVVGVIWKNNVKLVKKNIKLKNINEKLLFPKFSKLNRTFIEQFSNYNLISRGLVLNLFLYKNGFKSLEKGLKKIENFKKYYPKLNKEDSFNKEQRQVYKKILKNLDFKKYSTSLVQGVPGSGKTHVYFKIISEALKKGFQVLVMLPEKGLSEQVAKRFQDYFNYDPAIWHSGIKDKEKKIIWKGVFKNEIKLVLGARSAMFLPFQNLRLIILDEEHDTSYKQDEGVSFNARDMSILRGSLEQFPIFLVSATPSVETFYNSKIKKFNKYDLPSRFNESKLPKVKTIKLTKENISKNNFVSQEIVEEIRNYLKSGDQVLFFLNRRGHSTFIFCYNCMKRLECPKCSVGLVYHKKKNHALCHYCNHVEQLNRNCHGTKKCEFKFFGIGLEKVYEEIKEKFKGYKTDILSSDLSEYEKFSDQLKAIEENKTKIIVATQIVAKGFNFKNLNLIVALNCDSNILGNDIRASEKNFQLLYQLAGRAGRFNKESKIFLQTFDDENKIFDSLKNFEIEKFYDNEIIFRKNALLPPFNKFISIIISGRNMFNTEKFAHQLKQALPKNEMIKIHGPVSATIAKINSDYRVRLLIRYNPKVTPQSRIQKTIDILKVPKNIKLQVDVDPQNFT